MINKDSIKTLAQLIGVLLMIFGGLGILFWGWENLPHMAEIGRTGGITVGLKGAVELLVVLIPLGAGYAILKIVGRKVQ